MRNALGAVALWIIASPAFAAPTVLFDFDAYPDSSRCNPPVDAPTCQHFLELMISGNLGNDENLIPVFTTVGGVRMDVFQQVPAGYEWQNGVLASLGDIPFSTPISVRFSTLVTSAQIDLAALSQSQGPVQFLHDPVLFLEGYDDRGALVARVEAAVAVDTRATLSIAARPGHAFRTIQFAGGGPAVVPEWFGDDVVDVLNNSAADNLEVAPVPEPSGAAVFAAGLAAVLWFTRRPRAPRLA
jgi:hypothetical protein